MRIIAVAFLLAFPASAQIPLSDVFTWSEAGPVVYSSVRLPDGGTTAPPGTTECLHIFEPNETTWSNTYLCSPYAVGLTYSATGPIAGSSCTQLRVSADVNWSGGTHYVCLPPTLRISDYLFWTSGALPLQSNSCIRVTNALEPVAHGWSNVWWCHTDAPGLAPDLSEAQVTNGGAPSSATALQLQLKGFFFGAPTTMPVVTVRNGPASDLCSPELDGGVSTHTAGLMRCSLGPSAALDSATSLTVEVRNYGMTGIAASITPPPVISGLTAPAQAPTSGGWLLTIDGRFFGDTPTILVNGQFCAPQGTSTRTRLQCLMPAGIGTATVLVLSGGRQSNFATIRYDAPSITTASFDAARNLVTLTGFNFGLTGLVTVGGLVCIQGMGSSWTNTSIVCSPDAMLSGNQPVLVVVGGQQASSTVLLDRCPADPNKLTPGACGCGVDESADGGCGNACTASSQCQSGRVCVDGVCCDGTCGGGATDDCFACSRLAGGPVNGTCVPLNLRACDDHDACTRQEQCVSGSCTAGLPVSCPPSDECHSAGVCGAGACRNPPLPDGTNCSLGFCAAGACVARPCAQMPCFPGVTCIDVPGASPTFFCGVCPPGLVGDGVTCTAADAGVDGGFFVDAGMDGGLDAGVDGGLFVDAGVDGGLLADAGLDAGPGLDGGDDGGLVADAGESGADAGEADAGVEPGNQPTGCGCNAPGGLGGVFLGVWLLLRRRPEGRGRKS